MFKFAALAALALTAASSAWAQTTPAIPDNSAYILTPAPAPAPRINGPKVFGVRPGNPLLYSIPATGDRPLEFSAEGLPAGATLDAKTGRITGKIKAPGEYKVTLRAKNALGTSDKPLLIVVGEEIGLTPALGWNSYNCFGERITQDLALRAARAMVKFGLDQHGWTYINMDDGWQGNRGGPTNAMQPNSQRFTDIKAMVDEIHGLGLKCGIYSSPWVVTYGGFLGSSAENPEGASQRWPSAPKNAKQLPSAIGKYRFTYQDAQQYADWGFDYLKLDWGPVEAPETREWHQALRITGRDILLSLSNNHVKNLFPLIGEVGPWAQSWRTTTDIRDVWSRITTDIGFAEDPWAPYCRPGHFNDADMLVVGWVGGWSGPNGLHASNLKPNEQYTHISLWCLLTSPLLIGCDLERADAFTLSLLSNDEVLEVNQDALCKQAIQVGGGRGELKVFAKPLDDGSYAVGLFNAGPAEATVAVNWADLKLQGNLRVRNLWRQKDLGQFEGKFETPVAAHGVVLVRIFPSQ